ncbi:MAG: hypothetical protein Q8L68_01060 [Methylococcales bacterium]|nr:hypothetical protein [Methylococcales bacterium]
MNKLIKVMSFSQGKYYLPSYLDSRHNSPDILTKDSAGNVLEHIQVKLYKPGEDGLNRLITNIKMHSYDNTSLIVNEEHVAALCNKCPDLKFPATTNRMASP